MAEQLKELIQKIQDEGVKAAEEKARAIEDEARRTARGILQEAQKDAEVLVLEAKDRAANMEQSGKAALKQVSRDMLLTLKEEINQMLARLVTARVNEALRPEELARILSVLIKESSGCEHGDVVVSLKKDDAHKLEQSFLSELKKQTQRGILLKASEDIRGGFTISYDSGKSLFDFTDKALAEYIGTYLKPKLAEILSEEKAK